MAKSGTKIVIVDETERTIHRTQRTPVVGKSFGPEERRECNASSISFPLK